MGTAMLAIAVFVWQFSSSTKEREQAIERQTQHVVRATEAHVLYAIQFVDLSLLGFANAIKVLPPEKSASAETITSLLSSSGAAFNTEFWITFINAGGKGVATSNKVPIAGIDFSQRDYFQAHVDRAASPGMFIGVPALGKLTGQKLLFISRRVESASGEFLGVIVAPLDAGRFAEVFDNSRITQDVSITLVHQNGRVIARSPNFEKSFNLDVRDSALFQNVPKSKSGTFRTVSAIDRVPRIFSYRVLDNVPLILVVGSSDRGAGFVFDSVFVVAGAGLALLLTLMVISGHFALRSYVQLEERELRYRQLYKSSRETEEKLFTSEQRLRLIADNLPIVIAYVNREERYAFTNRQFHTVFGCPMTSCAGLTVAEVVGPQLYAATQRHLQRAFGGKTVTFEREFEQDGEKRWDCITYVPDFDAKKQVLGLFVMAEDITERRKNEESMQLATLMYQNSSEGMMVTDAGGAILSVNPAFSRISGYAEREVVGRQAYELTSGRQDIKFFSKMRHAIFRTGQWEGEVWHQTKKGEHYLVSLRFNTVFDEKGQAFRRVALFSDVTKKKASEELIWKQANFDTLTGLPNRRMFYERLRLEMKKSDRADVPMALVFIDLDGFKGVNDTLGHDMGDLLLQQVAERLGNCVRTTDIVARLGGDEFTVILGELKNPADVVRIAQAVLQALAQPFHLGKENAHISASIGITLYPNDGADCATLLKNADQAMYVAKQQGRNRFNYFAPFMQEATRIRMTLANELRDALHNDELRVVYQPIVELASGRICKAEALVRWQHPSRGLLSPIEFLAVAETTGIIIDIGDWVFQQAARQAKRMQQLHGADFQICVNKSSWQFRENSSDYRSWLEFLSQMQLDARSVVIEVTESLLLETGNDVSDKLASFRAANMQLSLDDFGAGYCSLAFLKRFHIDYLKIDPAFVCGMAEGRQSTSLCKAIIAMAHTMNIQVIAEGIESCAQVAELQAAGCDFGQGYLYSRPISGEELEKAVLPVDNSMNIHRTTCE